MALSHDVSIINNVICIINITIYLQKKTRNKRTVQTWTLKVICYQQQIMIKHLRNKAHYQLKIFSWININNEGHSINKLHNGVKGKGSPYSIMRVGFRSWSRCLAVRLQVTWGINPVGGRLPLLSVRPAVTPTTLKTAATNFAAWCTKAQRVWTVYLRLLPDSVATAIWTRALLCLSPAR